VANTYLTDCLVHTGHSWSPFLTARGSEPRFGVKYGPRFSWSRMNSKLKPLHY